MLLLSSCTTKPSDETSPADAVLEAGILTGVYAYDAKAGTDYVSTALLPVTTDNGDGFRFAYASSDDDITELYFVTYTGGVEITETVEKKTATQTIAIGERGVYAIETSETAPTRLYHYSHSGETLKATAISNFAPPAAVSDYPGQSSYLAETHLPILELDDGYVLSWDQYVITLDRNFKQTAVTELPSVVENLLYDDTSGTVWAHYINDGPMLHNLTADEVHALPHVFASYKTSTDIPVIGVKDGWVYGQHSDSVFRWQIGTVDIAELMNFQNSSLTERPMRIHPIFTPDGEVHFSILFADCTLCHHIPAEDISLDDTVLLELCYAGRNYDLQKDVIEFNASQKECRIILNDYSRYNTPDDINAGLSRFRLDLESGIIRPDILVADDSTVTNILLSDAAKLTDLYTLDYSGAKYTPDDMWNSVRHSSEYNGSLYSVNTDYVIHTLVGLHDSMDSGTGDAITGWNLEEFLDYAESLPDGEYIIDKFGKDTYYAPFHTMFQWLPFAQKESFDDPVYLRYLNYINRLPSKAPTIQQPRSSNYHDLSMAGGYDNDDVFFDAGGDNMYRNGTIKTADVSLSTIVDIFRIMDKLGAESASELNFVGYPAENRRGIYITDDWDNHISITSFCEHKEMAWKFIEFILEKDADYAEDHHGILKRPGEGYYVSFTTLRQPTVDYLNSIDGLEVFYDYIYTYFYTDPAEIARLSAKNPGRLFTVDADMIETIITLLDGEYLTLADSVTIALRNIVQPEEKAMLNGSQTPDTTFSAVKSRTALYFAEQGE